MAYQFGPLEAMMHVQQQGEMGRQRGEQSRLARLVSQGMSEPGGLAKIAPEVAKIDPNAAFALQDRESQAMDKRRELLVDSARYLAAMPTEQRAQVWPTVKARFSAADPELFAALPDAYDPQTFDPMIQQLAGLGQQGNISARAAGFEQLASGLTPEQRQQALAVELGLSPRAVAPGYAVKEVTNPDGTTSFVQIATKGTAPGSAIPVGQSGAPQMNDLIAQANQMVRAGRPVEEVDAWLQNSAQSAPNVRMGMGQSDAERAAAKAEETRAVERAKAEVKREANAPKERARYEQALATAQNVETSIEKALAAADWNSTGFMGARLRGLEGSDAYNLAAEIETIKANLGFDRLQQMRDNSPTGGALGQVAIQELVALQSTVANLDPNQDAEQLKANLQRIRDHYARWKAAVQQALNEGGTQQQPANGGWSMTKVEA